MTIPEFEFVSKSAFFEWISGPAMASPADQVLT
jgi:hypothetical protein